MKRKRKTDDKLTAPTAENSTASGNEQPGNGPASDGAARRAMETWTEEELDALAAKAAEQAKPLEDEGRKIGFGYGRIGAELHAEVLNGGKRVPDNEDTYRRLSKKLAGLGIKKSHKRLRALAKAYELQAALGGEVKAPDLTPDHYVEVAVDGLTLEQQREILETASEKMMASGALRKYVKAKMGELGKELERDAAYWLDRFEKSVSRGQSILTESCVEMSDRGIEIPTYTRDQLIYTAVFIYQFATRPFNPGGEK